MCCPVNSKPGVAKVAQLHKRAVLYVRKFGWSPCCTPRHGDELYLSRRRAVGIDRQFALFLKSLRPTTLRVGGRDKRGREHSKFSDGYILRQSTNLRRRRKKKIEFLNLLLIQDLFSLSLSPFFVLPIVATFPLRNRASTRTQLLHIGSRLVSCPTRSRRVRSR